MTATIICQIRYTCDQPGCKESEVGWSDQLPFGWVQLALHEIRVGDKVETRTGHHCPKCTEAQ